ncbi:MAG: squalene--hopene cyclase, partial [Anaerolineae bacterium]
MATTSTFGCRTKEQALAQAIARARAHLLSLQSPDGHWVGELEADASVTAGYLPLMHFLGCPVGPARQRQAVEQVLRTQNENGSWSLYRGGPGDLSVSVQACFSLRLAGVPPEAPCLAQAREFILSRGGIGRANVLTRIWLALFGQYDWRHTPSIPPEVILVPPWTGLSIYEFSSWSRATIVALALLLSRKPVCTVPESARLDDLYAEPPGQRRYAAAQAPHTISWERLFLLLDTLFKQYERRPLAALRRTSERRVGQWIVDHQEADGSWGGIMLPWVYSLMALKTLGFGLEHPVMRKGLEGLEKFIREDGATLRLQPATSPVWDTAWAVLALRASGLEADHPALQRAGIWLLSREVRTRGDWQVKNPRLEPGGWAFEFENECYPDMDDSAVVARALRRVHLVPAEEAAKEQAISRARRWIAGMQSRDGGWAAFDRDCDLQPLAHVPFADFLTPLDPTCADVTAHVVELLAELDRNSPALRRALGYLERQQEADGSWYGRWGVNYVYG